MNTGWDAIVERVERPSPRLLQIDVRTQGATFPPVSPGSHAVLAFGDASHRWKNAYSIVARSDDGRCLRFVVRLATPSRGGSRFLHDLATAGMSLRVASITNLFPIVHTARRHVMVSAGVGITPFLAYCASFQAEGSDYALHHVCRPDELDAFAALLPGGVRDRTTFHTRRDAFDLKTFLVEEPIAARLYTCGPDAFVAAVTDAATSVGFARAKIHVERFAAPETGRAFTVELARSGRRIAVEAEQSLLEALEAANVDAPSLCRGGACGQCAVAVCAGTPDHRDHFLTAAEREAGNVILTCVSRAISDTLVLDL